MPSTANEDVEPVGPPSPDEAPAGASNSLAEARARIGLLEREARALGEGPEAALLFHEMGVLWEDPLHNPRNAAAAFQTAFRLAPRFVENLRAARRIFSDAGNWHLVLQLLDAELEATPAGQSRAGLLYERALVLDERLERHEEAAEAFRQVVAAQPGDVGLLSQLTSVWAARGDARALADTLQLLAQVVEDPRVAAEALLSAGLLLEERLRDEHGAAEAYREAFALDRGDPVLLAALGRVAAREQRDDELLRVLAAEAENVGPSGSAAFLELARVYERLGRPEDALAALQAARRLQPRDPLLLSAMAALLGEQRRPEELAEVLGAWAATAHDEAEAVTLYLRLASLYEEALHRDEQAVQSYRAILARVPGNGAALAGLGRLHARRRDWPGLLEVYDAELAVTLETAGKATIHYRSGEIYEARLRDPESAINRYQQALLLSPGYLPAQQALERLFERLGRWADLAAMLEQDVLQAVGPSDAVARLGNLASLYEARLGDLERALECLHRALDLSPKHLPSLRQAQGLAEKLGRWRDLVDLLEREAAQVGDMKQVVALRHRAAEVLDERLSDPAAAVGAYEKLLTVSPAYLPALTALGRLYAEGGRWADLALLYRTEAAVAPPERAAQLLLKVGELQERRLGDVDAALATYGQVLERTPRDLQALGALGRLHRARGAWPALVTVLLREAGLRTDPRDRADVLFEAASLREYPLQDVEAATETYEEVLRLSPAHVGALRALERLASARGDNQALLAAVERTAQTAQAPEARVAAYLKLTRLYLDRLGEPTRAAQMAEAALAIDPRNLHALLVLERVRSADPGRRGEVKARLADRVTDAGLASALRLVASRDREETDREARARELGEAFLADPTDLRVTFALDRTLRLGGDPAARFAFYARRLQQVHDGAERLALQMRLAEAAEAGAADLPTAREAYRDALVLHPGFLPALQGIRRVADRLGDWPTAVAAREAEAEASHDVRSSVDAWTNAGRLAHERLGDRERALHCFERALERDALNREAFAQAERILAEAEHGDGLARLYERQGEARLAAGDRSGAAASFHRAAETWRESVRDPVRALATLERVLDADPGHAGALLDKAELALEQGRWADAAEAFTARVRLGGEPEVLSSLHLRLGALFQERLGDPTRAVAHFQAALAGHPGLPEALERLVALYIASENWTGASDSLKRLLDLDNEPQARGRYLLQLARILDNGFGDTLRAGDFYRQALEFGAEDPAALDRLAELAEREGEVAGLLQLLEAQALVSKPPRAARLSFKLGELCATVLGDETRAILTYRRATELQPGFLDAHAALARLLEKDPGSIEQAIQAYRAVIGIDATHAESLHALFRIWEQARSLDRAFCAAAVLVFLQSATDRESNLHFDWRARLPAEGHDQLSADELSLLQGPAVSAPLVDVLRAAGDEMGQQLEPAFDSLGVDVRLDRLRADHPVHRAVRLVADTLDVDDFAVYQARRGLVVLEPSAPPALCVGQDVVKRFNAREQKFLFGRAVLGLRNHAAVLSRLSMEETARFLGAAVRIAMPSFAGLGPPDEELSRTLRRQLSRRRLRELGLAARAVASSSRVDLSATLRALSAAANRAGMLMAGDPALALQLVLREDPSVSGTRPETPEPVLQAVRERADLRSLIAFALSDAFFHLRRKAGLALPETVP
ncbi:MAG: tetratricopeptide repeat protein [Myxococcaceae bacterium]